MFLKIIKRYKNKIKNKKAQEAIELGLMVPIMTIILLSAFDISQVVKAKWEALQLARTGARTAVMTGAVSGSTDTPKPPVGMDKEAAEASITASYKEQHKNESNPRIVLSNNKFAGKGYFFASMDNGSESMKPNGEHQAKGQYNLIKCEVCMDVKIMIPALWKDSKNGIYTTCEQYTTTHSSIYQHKNKGKGDGRQSS